MTVQIAVKLRESDLAAVDRLVEAGRYRSRSEAVRAGLALVVERGTAEAIDRAFRVAFARCPDTPEEMAQAYRNGIESINEEPWEKWW